MTLKKKYKKKRTPRLMVSDQRELMGCFKRPLKKIKPIQITVSYDGDCYVSFQVAEIWKLGTVDGKVIRGSSAFNSMLSQQEHQRNWGRKTRKQHWLRDRSVA